MWRQKKKKATYRRQWDCALLSFRINKISSQNDCTSNRRWPKQQESSTVRPPVLVGPAITWCLCLLAVIVLYLVCVWSQCRLAARKLILFCFSWGLEWRTLLVRSQSWFSFSTIYTGLAEWGGAGWLPALLLNTRPPASAAVLPTCPLKKHIYILISITKFHKNTVTSFLVSWKWLARGTN